MINRKYIPNMITSSRFMLAVIFLLILLSMKWSQDRKNCLIPLTGIFAMICTTDFVDGKIARKLNSVSNLGAILDVSADFFYIVSAFAALNFLQVVPLWFTMTIIIKFAEFIATSYIMKKCNKNIKTKFVFDYFGRISAIMFYLLPGIIIFLFVLRGMTWVIDSLLYITALTALISFATRCIYSIKLANNLGYRRKTYYGVN